MVKIFSLFTFSYFQSTLQIHVFDKHTLQGYSKDYLKQFDQEAKEKVLELMRKFGLYQVAEKLQLPGKQYHDIIISIS